MTSKRDCDCLGARSLSSSRNWKISCRKKEVNVNVIPRPGGREGSAQRRVESRNNVRDFVLRCCMFMETVCCTNIIASIITTKNTNNQQQHNKNATKERNNLNVPIYFSAGLTEKANQYYKLFISWTNQKIKKTFVEHNMFEFKHILPFDRGLVDEPGQVQLHTRPPSYARLDRTGRGHLHSFRIASQLTSACAFWMPLCLN